jgi:DNA-binding NtrC family response regulator
MSDILHKVLIVDDDVAVTNYFMVFLMQTEIFEPTVVNDSRQVMDLLRENEYQVMMLDLDMPNITGMEILQQMNAAGVDLPVIILTGASDVDLAVRAMKQGAFDYLTKPVDDEHLLDVLGSAVEMGSIKQSMDELSADRDVSHDDLDNKAAFEHLPTRDATMLRLFQKVETLAEGNLSIFLSGERGTGKNWLAQAIHQASPRCEGPYVYLDCTQHPTEAFSGQLFGQAPSYGGQTQEISGALSDARGGTLFLNNIEHMTPQVQMRLNHALHTGEYYRDNSTEILQADVRYIVASTRDLTSPAFQETFSRDLLYHVMVNSLSLPPLRERAEDIPLLAQFFLEEFNRKGGTALEGLTEELQEKLKKYYFPGNLQELKSLIKHAAAEAQGPLVGSEDLSKYTLERITLGAIAQTFQPVPLRDVVLKHVKATLEFAEGDRERAAQLLQVTTDELKEHLPE